MRVVTLMVFVVTLATGAHAQTSIGGIINSYYSVVTVNDCDSTVVITDPQGLNVGDKVLIQQVKGALIHETNDVRYGRLLSLESAGCVEFMVVKAIRGPIVEFSSRFVHRYASDQKVQMIRVPIYDNAIVTSDIVAKPWDGNLGGVIAFEVMGTLTLNANISADSLGFHGGVKGGRFVTSCNVTEWRTPYSDGLSGGKGESIVNQDNLAARGHLLAGGGGGNGNNAGGGGGANGGVGGAGGDANIYCSVTQVGGLGGRPLASHVPLQRMFFGSGGGGGHENRDPRPNVSFQATGGANGGGLVIIRAGTIVANGNAITANGAGVTELAGWDAAGGGGAGGTVYLEAATVNGQLRVEANGGKGGDIGSKPTAKKDEKVFQAAGPGGGGGGGVIILPKTQTNILTSILPGVAGNHTEPLSTHYNNTRGATAGTEGVVITEFTWGEPKHYELEAGGDATICPVGSAMLWAKPGFLSYRWSTGDTGRTVSISAAGTYYVDAVDSLGCVHRFDNINVLVDPSQFQLDSATDFGSCDLNVMYTRTIRYVNTDDEMTVINSITVPAPFAIISPVLPAVLQPGAGIDIVISLVPTVEGEIEDTLRLLIQAPCADSAIAILRSRVNPVYSDFVVGNTVAHVGDLGVQVPVSMRMRQDSTHLDNVTLRFDLSFDSRAFAPTAVSRGRRVRDLIDFELNRRTLTIEIDSVFIRGTEDELTILVGTILNSGLDNVNVDITNLKWVVASRDPITTVTPGSITVIGGCAADARVVRFVDMPTATLHPNPASDNVTIDVGMTLRGEYAVTIFDVEGRSLFKYSDFHVDGGARTVPLIIPVDQWESGSYVVMFNSPTKSQAFPLHVVK